MPCPPPYIGVDGTYAGALPFPSTSSLLSCYTPLICGLVHPFETQPKKNLV